MQNYKWLLLFCGIYLTLAALLFVNVPYQSRLEIDSGAYIDQVETFEATGAFTNDKVCRSPYSMGYPLFLAAIRASFGDNFAFVVFVQIVLALCMIFLTFSLASCFFNNGVALLSAFLASINLGLILYPQFILTETLICFLILFAFERLAAYFTFGGRYNIAISGLVYGISVVIKPAAIYYALFLAILLIALKKPKKSILFLIMFSLPVGAYMVRNKKTYGHYYLKSIDKINLYFYFLPKILYETQGVEYNDAIKQIDKLSDTDELASGQRWGRINRYFIKTIIAHPILAVKIWMKNVVKTLLGLYTNHLKVLLSNDIVGGTCSFFRIKGNFLDKVWGYLNFGNSKLLLMLGMLELIWNIIRYIAVIAALISLTVRKQFLILVLLGSYVGYFAMITGHDGCGRFRFMFELPLLVLAAVGFFALKTRLERDVI